MMEIMCVFLYIAVRIFTVGEKYLKTLAMLAASGISDRVIQLEEETVWWWVIEVGAPT